MRSISTHWILTIVLLVVGGAVLGGEYLLVKWLPGHRQSVAEETLKPVSYSNEKLGFSVEIASGLASEPEEFAGGVRMSRFRLLGTGPSLSFTFRPNPDGTHEFNPYALAKWQTADIYEKAARYKFEQLTINNRNAVLIRQLKGKSMLLTARVITPERIVEMNCFPGDEDETLYMRACDETARSLYVAGTDRPVPPQPIYELSPPPRRRPK